MRVRGHVDDFRDFQLGRALPTRRLRFRNIEIAPDAHAFGVVMTGPTPA
jgi:hypothetical protein